jgi:hypothetical protein
MLERISSGLAFAMFSYLSERYVFKEYNCIDRKYCQVILFIFY